jgi:hypothetical protein
MRRMPHPATEALLRFFEYEHLPDHLQDISRPFHRLAHDLAGREDLQGAELTVALRKLLESKDCAVRAAL